MIDQIVESTQEHWEELWSSNPRPKDLRYLLQSRRRVILFLFDAQKKGDKLVGVVKISRRVEENDQLERSVKLIGKVRKQLDGHILETVPRAIMLEPIHGLSVSLEQGLPGDPMYIGHNPWIATRWHWQNWQAWRQWLAEFQRQTAIASSTIRTHIIEELITSDLVHTPDHDPTAPHVIRDLQIIAKKLDGLVINQVWRYGDAHHSNILIDKGEVSGVVDWEGMGAYHWPTTDWFQFAFQYLVDSYRVKSPNAPHSELGKRAIDALLQPASSSLGAMIQEQTRMFLAAWGIGASAIPAFFVVFLAQFYWPWDKRVLLKHTHTVLCE